MTRQTRSSSYRPRASWESPPSSAINIFVRKFNECGSFPFDVRLDRERSNTTRLDAEAFDAFLSALDEPMPAKAQELLSRDYS